MALMEPVGHLVDQGTFYEEAIADVCGHRQFEALQNGGGPCSSEVPVHVVNTSACQTSYSASTLRLV